MEFFLKLLNRKGQSIVEYVLLMSVLVGLTATIFNSRYFKNFLGDDSKLFEKLRKKWEYTYRHGRSGLEDKTASPEGIRGQSHETYKGRFFTPLSKYP